MDRRLIRAPRDLESVSQALRALGELRLAIDHILCETEIRIRRLEAQARRRCAPLRRRARDLENGLERFCADHPELLGQGQRLDLPAGSLGFTTRRTLHPAPGLTWGHIAPRLAPLGLPSSPASPAGVALHALAGLPEPTLHALGITATADTDFWCQPRVDGTE